jgi:hypothetical protein
MSREKLFFEALENCLQDVFSLKSWKKEIFSRKNITNFSPKDKKLFKRKPFKDFYLHWIKKVYSYVQSYQSNYHQRCPYKNMYHGEYMWGEIPVGIWQKTSSVARIFSAGLNTRCFHPIKFELFLPFYYSYIAWSTCSCKISERDKISTTQNIIEIEIARKNEHLLRVQPQNNKMT